MMCHDMKAPRVKRRDSPRHSPKSWGKKNNEHDPSTHFATFCASHPVPEYSTSPRFEANSGTVPPKAVHSLKSSPKHTQTSSEGMTGALGYIIASGRAADHGYVEGMTPSSDDQAI